MQMFNHYFFLKNIQSHPYYQTGIYFRDPNRPCRLHIIKAFEKIFLLANKEKVFNKYLLQRGNFDSLNDPPVLTKVFRGATVTFI